MRLISLVPSLTETLIDCGLDVVGRTRFCIHPSDRVKDIPAVAGTKDVNWQKLADLKPDLVIFDKEENTKEMFEECSFNKIALHIESTTNVASELSKLYEKINEMSEERFGKEFAKKNSDGPAMQALKNVIEEWQTLEQAAKIKKPVSELPGVMEWLNKPNADTEIEQVVYVIWKKPWMAAGRNTFIGSMLDRFGLGEKLFTIANNKYPEFELSQFDREKTLYLFSSEPFPFAKKKNELSEVPGYKAIIDGELFSWYGTRSLRFLQSCYEK